MRPKLIPYEGQQAVYHDPNLFVVRLENGFPHEWRHVDVSTPLDSFYLQPYNGITKKGKKWLMPIMNFDLRRFAADVPLEYEVLDMGVELCAASVSQVVYNRLPDEALTAAMPYLFSEYQYVGDYRIFSFVNKIINTANGIEMKLSHQIGRLNDFTKSDSTSIQEYQVVAAAEVDEELYLLTKSRGIYFYSIMGRRGEEFATVRLGIKHKEGIQWGLDGEGRLVGFDTEHNALLRLR